MLTASPTALCAIQIGIFNASSGTAINENFDIFCHLRSTILCQNFRRHHGSLGLTVCAQALGLLRLYWPPLKHCSYLRGLLIGLLFNVSVILSSFVSGDYHSD